MILNVSDITKSFAGKDVLKDVSFHIGEHEKTALIGINGAGKSTLLKIIMGLIAPDSGRVVLASGASVGYLAQHQDLTGDRTIFEQLLSVRRDILELSDSIHRSEQKMSRLEGAALEDEMKAYARMTETFEREGGYAYRSEVTGILRGLGFEENEFGKKAGELSGGQKTRVSLGKLLLTSPDLIMLDEPTNHLDVHSIEWLETYLVNYRGAVLTVSHDRYFLNKIVTKVIEIENGKSRVFLGNYDDFSRKKEALRKAEYAAYLNAARERKHQEEVIATLRRFNREKSIRRAESREKMLARTEEPEKPAEANTSMALHFSPSVRSGNDVLRVEGLAKSFDGIRLFSDVSFEIHRGEHVVLIGENGTGKSTIMKILNGAVPADAGTFVFGSKVCSAYYDQEIMNLDGDKTIFEEISDDYPSMNNTEIRTRLAAFLFTGDDVFKQISSLSGGERARVSLLKLMLSDANLLFLDEPTNHLDIESREILESAVRSYDGTVLAVSHDRYFINRTATRILDLTHRRVLNYDGNYDYYLEKREIVEAASLPAEGSGPEEKTESAARLDWKSQKEEEARRRKAASDLRKCEERIGLLENEDAELDRQIADPDIAADYEKLTALTVKKSELAKTLEAEYARWEKLQEDPDAFVS